MKRSEFQALIKTATKWEDREDFILREKGNDVPAAWCRNIWDVAHAGTKEIRYETGLSQAEFAKAIGASQRNVEYWDSPKGWSNCPLYAKIALAELVGLVKIPLEW